MPSLPKLLIRFSLIDSFSLSLLLSLASMPVWAVYYGKHVWNNFLAVNLCPLLPSVLKNSFALKVKLLVAQSCPALCNPMNWSLLGSSLHGIFQDRLLEWVAIPFSRDLPNPGIKLRSPASQADSLPSEPPGKLHAFRLPHKSRALCVYFSKHIQIK